MKSQFKTASETLNIAGTRVEVKRWGKGRPLLLLHGEDGFEFNLPLIDNLASNFEIVSPRMPGFGKSSIPDAISSIDDISYVWLGLMDRLDLQNTTVLGFSVGGWVRRCVPVGLPMAAAEGWIPFLLWFSKGRGCGRRARKRCLSPAIVRLFFPCGPGFFFAPRPHNPRLCCARTRHAHRSY